MIEIYNLKDQLLCPVKEIELYQIYDEHSQRIFFALNWTNKYGVPVRVDLHSNAKFYLKIDGVKYDYYKILENPERVKAFIEQENNKDALENLPG